MDIKDKIEGVYSQKTLARLRFIGYMAVSCASIAIPMLVYLITKDIKIAGIYLMFEWVSKIIFYAFGGSLLNIQSLRRSMLYADLMRIFGYLVLVFVYFSSTTWMLLPAIIFVQVGNGVSNLVFERSVFSLWEHDRVAGYSSLIKLDYLAVGCAVLFSLLTNQILVLLLFCLVVMCVNAAISYKIGHLIFPKQEAIAMTATAIAKNTTKHFFNVISNQNLIYLIFFSLCCSTVLNMIFTTMSFFVERYDHDLSTSLRFVALLVAIKALLSSSLLHGFSLMKGRYVDDHHYLQFGISLWLVAFIGFLFENTLTLFLVCAFVGAVGNALLTVWLRNHRNYFIQIEIRNEQISLIIALECLSYVFAGFLMTLSREFFDVLLVLNILGLLYLLMRLPKAPMLEQEIK